MDLEKLGYLNHPDVQIIIHDNDSKEKNHCLKIKDLQKTVRNLALIESSPNIGMVKGCYKILTKAKGSWITLLGDDDPIIIKCSDFLSIIQRNKDKDHLYFTPKIYNKDKIRPIRWVPSLKVGSYDTSFLCAKQGFTTAFAFLGSHCFRSKKDLPKKWLKSHGKSMFYGHCIMFIERFKNSFYTGKTIAAWRAGNERMPHPFHYLRFVELKVFLKYPQTKAIKRFISLKPQEIVEQGIYPLSNHINHPDINFINKNEQLPKKERIIIKHINNIKYTSHSKIYISSPKAAKRRGDGCIFSKQDSAKQRKQSWILFKCGPSASLSNMIEICKKLEILGRVIYKEKAIALHEYIPDTRSGHKTYFTKARKWAIYLFSSLLYGPEDFMPLKILKNFETRPEQGLYKVCRTIERTVRVSLQKNVSIDTYNNIKTILNIFLPFTKRKQIRENPIESCHV
jgi:hypothetical protein